MAKKRAFQEKTKDTGIINVMKKPRQMKKQIPAKGAISKSHLREENFFIKPFEKINTQDVSSKQYSESASTSSSKEKLHGIVSSEVFNRKEGIKQTQDKITDKTDTKKPFDKKLYRLKKYSNKYKVQQWEEKRKKSALHEYKQTFRNDNEPKLDVAKIYEEDLDSNESITHIDADNENNSNTAGEKIQKIKNKRHFLKPHERYQQIKEEKQKKMEEITRKKLERDEARRKALKERIERNKKLKQKTKKGQPIMKYRIEMLLEKIEKSLKE